MKRVDWPQVRKIYEQGILTGNATFEKSVPDWHIWDASHMQKTRLVAKMAEKVVGWAALSPVSDRCAYQGVAEVSIYVDTGYSGRGIGSILLGKLIELAERQGLWTLQAGIFPENEVSIHIHK